MRTTIRLEKSHLDEIPPASCGLPQDETIFDTNAYGVVGAFVLVTNVGGMFYEFVKGMHDAYKHISPHVSIVPQHAERLNSSRRVWQVGAATETRGSSLRLGNDVLRGTCVAPSFTLGTTLNTSAQNFWWDLGSCSSAIHRNFWNLWAACDTFKAVAVIHTQGTLTSVF